MAGTVWQKSSYSGSGGNGECVELMATEDLYLRESDDPETVLAARSIRFAALLSAVKAGQFDRLC